MNSENDNGNENANGEVEQKVTRSMTFYSYSVAVEDLLEVIRPSTARSIVKNHISHHFVVNATLIVI